MLVEPAADPGLDRLAGLPGLGRQAGDRREVDRDVPGVAPDRRAAAGRRRAPGLAPLDLVATALVLQCEPLRHTGPQKIVPRLVLPAQDATKSCAANGSPGIHGKVADHSARPMPVQQAALGA